MQFYNSPRIRKAAAEMVSPLERHGIDVFEVRDGPKGKPVEIISKPEVASFVAASEQVPAIQEREVVASEYETVVRIVKPSLDPKEDYKWTLSDGDKSFFAEIEDSIFLTKVRSREIKFASGDLMRVRIYVRSMVADDGNIRNERIVREVIQFIEPPKQMPLIQPDER